MLAHILKLHGNAATRSSTIQFLKPSLLFLHHYSTTTTTTTRISKPKPTYDSDFLIDYLIKTLDFTRKDAISTVTRITETRIKKITPNPETILSFFLQTGLDKTHIRSIISTLPNILFSNIDKTVKPKLKILQDLGLSGSDLVRLVMGNSRIFSRGLESHLRPTIRYLKEVLGSDHNVILAIKKSSWLLSCNAPKRFAPNVLLLRKFGFSDEKIVKFVLLNPRNMMQKPEWLEDIVNRVENDFKLPRNSPMFFYGVDALSSLHKSTLEAKLGVFKSFGWSDEHIRTTVNYLPYTLRASEEKLRKGLEFFMKEVGLDADYLSRRPKLLMVSLETTAKPRYELLKALEEKHLIKRKVALYTAVCLMESTFLERHVLPYKHMIPDAYRSYIKKVGKKND